MRHFTLLQACQLLRNPSIRRYTDQAAEEMWCQDNAVVVPPSTSSVVGGFAQHYRRAAMHRYSFQLMIGEESQPLSVRREERILGIFGSGQRSSLDLVQEPRRQSLDTIRTADEMDQSISVRREDSCGAQSGDCQGSETDAQSDQRAIKGRPSWTLRERRKAHPYTADVSVALQPLEFASEVGGALIA